MLNYEGADDVSVSGVTLCYLAFLTERGDWPLSAALTRLTENPVTEEFRKAFRGKDLFIRFLFTMACKIISGQRNY